MMAFFEDRMRTTAKRAIGLMLSAAMLSISSITVTEATEVDLDKADRFEPTSHWVLDNAEGPCTLRRAFGKGDAKIILELRKFFPGASFQVTLAGNGVNIRPSTRPIQVRFLPDPDGEEMRSIFYYDLGDGQKAVVFNDSLLLNAAQQSVIEAAPEGGWTWSDAERAAREQAVTGLYLTTGPQRDLHLATGPLHDAMSVMRVCENDMLDRWGLDANAHETLTRQARPTNFADVAKLVQRIYPASMLRTRKMARMAVRVMVDQRGEATDCSVLGQFGPGEFDRRPCQILLEIAEFEPALDSSGNAIPSYWGTNIIYFIP